MLLYQIDAQTEIPKSLFIDSNRLKGKLISTALKKKPRIIP